MTSCRLVANGWDAQPGDMWFAPGWLVGDYLSNEYERDWLGKRPPLVVMLPDGVPFCVDSRAADSKEEGEGWTVTGEPPRITVHPSIQRGDEVHWWLREGELTPA